MPAPLTDEGLSEVIGFILILGIIAAVASLYITYVVPAQGRELEIKHMAQVNDQFLQYKTTIDSLWINGQENVPISNTFTLGTVTGLTQGAIVVPVFQPHPSSGMIVVNERGEDITLNADVLVQGFPGNKQPNINPIYREPDHLYIQLKTTNRDEHGGVIIYPDNPNPQWYIALNITPIIVSSGTSSQAPSALPTLEPPYGAPNIASWINTILVPNWTLMVQGLGVSRPALTMTLIKNDNATFSNLTIFPEIINNRNYTIDLLDDAYGLAEALDYPLKIRTPIFSTPNIQVFYPVQVGYNSAEIEFSHPMDSLEFRSSNNYWIQQDYYYQMGGVFLRQPDGMVSKVIPLISVTNKTGLPTVRMVDIFIDGSGNIGGSSPLQVVSTLTSLQENTIDQQKLATGIPNARNVTFIISAQDQQTAQMWNQTFSRIRQAALSEDFPPAWIPAPVQTGNTVQFTVRDPDNYSLFLDYTRVNLTVNLQTVAL